MSVWCFDKRWDQFVCVCVFLREFFVCDIPLSTFECRSLLCLHSPNFLKVALGEGTGWDRNGMAERAGLWLLSLWIVGSTPRDSLASLELQTTLRWTFLGTLMRIVKEALKSWGPLIHAAQAGKLKFLLTGREFKGQNFAESNDISWLPYLRKNMIVVSISDVWSTYKFGILFPLKDSSPSFAPLYSGTLEHFRCAFLCLGYPLCTFVFCGPGLAISYHPL